MAKVLVGAIAALCLAAGSAAAAVPVRRLGTVPPLPSGAQVSGPLAASTPLALTIALQPQDPQALTAFAQAVSTPGSPQFGHYLTAQAFAARFGAPANHIAAVEAALRSQGLTVGQPTANNLSLPVSGTAAQVERALQVSLSQVKLPGSERAFASTQAPALPSTVAGYVQGVLGLNSADLEQPNRVLISPHRGRVRTAERARAAASAGPKPCAAATQSLASDWQGLGYTADSIAAAYGLTSFYGAGNEAAGQKVALVEEQPYDPADIAAYQSCYGTSVQLSNVEVAGGATPPTDGDDGESALDIEQVIGLAPKADILVYEGPFTQQGNAEILNAIVADDQAKVISTSYGSCEPATDTTVLGSEYTSLEEAAAQGQTFFSASGDTGSQGCQFAATGAPAPGDQDPSSQPFAIGVGGTTMGNGTGQGFTTPNNGSHPNESVWNDGQPDSADPTNGEASGGGPSTIWPMPSYQSGAPSSVGVIGTGSSSSCGPQTNQPCREVPDVAANADPNSGYLVYENPGPKACPQATQTSCWIPVAGTSAASPVWAAFTALANASPVCRGLTLGFVDPALYSVAAGNLYASDFHDVTAANPFTGQANNDPFYNDPAFNTSDPNDLYPVEAGYDMTTGLGTLNAAALGPALCGLRAPVNKYSISSPGSRFPGLAQNSPKLTFTVKANGSAPSIASLTLALPGGVRFSGRKAALDRGIVIKTSGGKRLAFTSRLARGRLTITLRTPAPVVSFSLRRPAVSVSRALAKRVRRHKVRRVTVRVDALTTTHAAVDFKLRLKV